MPSELEKIIALSFDSDPKVRKKAAEELAKYDDPAALLALLELAGDKDKEVAETAARILQECREKREPKLIPLSEMFKDIDFSGRIEKVMEKSSVPESIKKKLVPKIIENAKEGRLNLEKLFGAPKIKEEKLTAFLEEVGSTGEELNPLLSELEALEKEMNLYDEAKVFQDIKPTFLRILYDSLVVSDGDVSVLEKQFKALKRFLDLELKLIYRVVKDAYARTKLVDLSEIKNGLKNVYTPELQVKKIEHLMLRERGKKLEVARIEVEDKEGKPGVVYLPKERALYLQGGMWFRVEKAVVKTFKTTGETAITITKKRGKVVIEL